MCAASAYTSTSTVIPDMCPSSNQSWQRSSPDSFSHSQSSNDCFGWRPHQSSKWTSLRVTRGGRSHLIDIKKTFKVAGYMFDLGVLDTQQYLLPQCREPSIEQALMFALQRVACRVFLYVFILLLIHHVLRSGVVMVFRVRVQRCAFCQIRSRTAFPIGQVFMLCEISNLDLSGHSPAGICRVHSMKPCL